MKKFLLFTLLAAAAFLLFRARINPPVPPRTPSQNLTQPQSLDSPAPNHSVAQSAADLTLPTEQIPITIRPIVDLHHDFAARQKLARSLPATLTGPELDALYAFLSAKHDEDDRQLAQSLKSDLMDALCAQTSLPIDLTKLLVQVYRDPDQNIVLRDYALQHLAILDQKQPLPWPQTEIESQHAEIHALLWQALDETDSSIAGTALLSLQRLAPPNDPDPRLSVAALKLARDPATGSLARLTAFQICAERGLVDAIPFLAQTAATDPDLSTRISAIAALGRLGRRDELALLDKIRAENNPRLNPALTLALHRLHLRLANP